MSLNIYFSKKSKVYLQEVKEHIAKNAPRVATQHITNLISRIINLLQYPKIGKINQVYNHENIREIFIDGYKVIYKINPKSILVLMIYKHLDFDEGSL
jgi:toxin ParE1/3/4